MSKKQSRINDIIEDFPENLDDHIFYGLVLDKEQRYFRDCIWSDNYDIIFSDSKAGTGKTLIALATAILLCKSKKYKGIIYIVSPTQEGKIGYLPGSPEEKISPYLAPIRSALLKLDIIPEEAIYQLASIEKQKEGTPYIDCISHLYLRGDNLDDKVIIIDETQNMYLDELKKTLTRINEHCKTIVIGHSGQCDLYKNPVRSGFTFYKEWYKDQERAVVCNLTTNHRGWVSKHADNLDTEVLCEYLEKNKLNDLSLVDLNDFKIE